jgi:hypothetical protein
VSISTPPPVSQRFDQLRVRSRRVLDLDLTRASIDPTTAQEPTFVRASTRTASDAFGVSYSAGNGLPAWSYASGDLGLLTGTTDVLWYPFPREIRELSGIVTFRNQGILGSTNHWIMAIGAADPLFRLEVSSSTSVTARLTNSSGTASTALSATSLAGSGDKVSLWWSIKFDGSNMRAQLRTKVNAGAWSALIAGSNIAKGTLLFSVSGSETMTRYNVSRAE